MRASGTYPGRGYRYYKGRVVYKFGHGLSYSQWRVAITPGTTNAGESAQGDTIGVNVTNLGPFRGARAIMVFATSPTIEETKVLVGFARSPVCQVGETVHLDVRILREDIARERKQYQFETGSEDEYFLFK
jgi:hypothetical protein